MDQKSVTVLGGEGFVGHNILDFLSRDYVCVSVAGEPSLFYHTNASFVAKNPYKETLKIESEVLIHLIDNQLSGEAFQQAEQTLIENTFTPEIRHAIVFSSAVVYAAPDSSYGQRKKALEEIWQKECQKRGVKLTIFRLFNVYGYYQLPYRQGSLVANIICNHLRGRVTEVNDLFTERDFLFASDMGKFVSLVIEQSQEGVFDLSSNELHSIRDIITLLEKIFHEEILIEDKGVKETVVSPAGKNPFREKVRPTPLGEGLQQAVAFYRDHLSVFPQD